MTLIRFLPILAALSLSACAGEVDYIDQCVPGAACDCPDSPQGAQVCPEGEAGLGYCICPNGEDSGAADASDASDDPASGDARDDPASDDARDSTAGDDHSVDASHDEDPADDPANDLHLDSGDDPSQDPPSDGLADGTDATDAHDVDASDTPHAEDVQDADTSGHLTLVRAVNLLPGDQWVTMCMRPDGGTWELLDRVPYGEPSDPVEWRVPGSVQVMAVFDDSHDCTNAVTPDASATLDAPPDRSRSFFILHRDMRSEGSPATITALSDPFPALATDEASVLPLHFFVQLADIQVNGRFTDDLLSPRSVALATLAEDAVLERATDEPMQLIVRTDGWQGAFTIPIEEARCTAFLGGETDPFLQAHQTPVAVVACSDGGVSVYGPDAQVYVLNAIWDFHNGGTTMPLVVTDGTQREELGEGELSDVIDFSREMPAWSFTGRGTLATRLNDMSLDPGEQYLVIAVGGSVGWPDEPQFEVVGVSRLPWPGGTGFEAFTLNALADGAEPRAWHRANEIWYDDGDLPEHGRADTIQKDTGIDRVRLVENGYDYDWAIDANARRALFVAGGSFEPNVWPGRPILYEVRLDDEGWYVRAPELVEGPVWVRLVNAFVQSATAQLLLGDDLRIEAAHRESTDWQAMRWDTVADLALSLGDPATVSYPAELSAPPPGSFISLIATGYASTGPSQQGLLTVLEEERRGGLVTPVAVQAGFGGAATLAVRGQVLDLAGLGSVDVGDPQPLGAELVSTVLALAYAVEPHEDHSYTVTEAAPWQADELEGPTLFIHSGDPAFPQGSDEWGRIVVVGPEGLVETLQPDADVLIMQVIPDLVDEGLLDHVDIVVTVDGVTTRTFEEVAFGAAPVVLDEVVNPRSSMTVTVTGETVELVPRELLHKLVPLHAGVDNIVVVSGFANVAALDGMNAAVLPDVLRPFSRDVLFLNASPDQSSEDVSFLASDGGPFFSVLSHVQLMTTGTREWDESWTTGYGVDVGSWTVTPAVAGAGEPFLPTFMVAAGEAGDCDDLGAVKPAQMILIHGCDHNEDGCECESGICRPWVAESVGCE